MADAARVIELIQETPGCRFETLQFHCRHFRSPISQSGSNGQRDTLVDDTSVRPASDLKILVMMQHRIFKRNAEKLAKRDAFFLWIGDEALIAHLIIQAGRQRAASFSTQTHVPFPP